MSKNEKCSHRDANMICMTAVLIELNPNGSIFKHVKEFIEHVDGFTAWETENVLCLENGWETYMENGGEDYESVIYEWAEKFRI